MPTKQTGTGENGEAVLVTSGRIGELVGFAIEVDGEEYTQKFASMREARKFCRAAFGVTMWATYPALLLLALLAGACAEDPAPFGGAAFGGSGTLVRGSAGAFGTGGAGGSGVVSTGGVPAASGGTPGTGGAVLPTESGGAGGGGASGTAGGGGAATAGMGGAPIVWGTGGHSATPADCYDKTKFWNAQNDQYMRPGSACNSCHQFTIAGTVFVQPTDPDNCYGVDGSKQTVSVLVVGSDNRALALKVNESGNFWTNTAVTFPATVSVNYGSGSLRMQATVTKGDCNSCHTASAFPGRILPP